MRKLLLIMLLIYCSIASAQVNPNEYNEFRKYNIEIRKGNGWSFIDDIIIFNRAGMYTKYKNIQRDIINEVHVEYPKVKSKEKIRMSINQLFASAIHYERCYADEYNNIGQGSTIYSIILRRDDEHKILYTHTCLPSEFALLIELIISQLPNKHRKYLEENFVRCFADQNEFDCFKKGEY